LKLLQNFDFERTYLRHFCFLNAAEKEMVRNWRNDERISKWFLKRKKISQEEHQAFINNLRSDDKNGYWLVFLKPDTPAGVIYLNKIDMKNSEAHLGIYANPEIHISGAGDILMESIFKLTFDMLQLGKLRLTVFKDNVRAIRLYEKWKFITDHPEHTPLISMSFTK